MEKQVSFETVMDALYKVALYDPDGHTAADANGLLELGYSYDDNASEFMAALNKTEKKLVKYAISNFNKNSSAL